MGIDDFSHTGLFLGLGISSPPLIGGHVSKNPSLTLSLSNERRSGGQDSAASCLSNGSVKRERTEVGGDDDVDDGSNGRKKLRLNKAQSAILEESFKRQNTLNHKEKLELSKELNLSPRQVEVWFQNRRARSKLKQTELDCELMKKWYETLIAENRRLQEEVRQLKAVKLAKLPPPPLYMPLPATAAALAICPSCETETATKRGFAVAPAPHLYSC